MWNQTSRVSRQTTSPATFYVFVKVAAMRPEIPRKMNLRRKPASRSVTENRASTARLYIVMESFTSVPIAVFDKTTRRYRSLNSKPPAESIGLRHARRDPDRDSKDARSRTRSGRTHGKVVLERRETSRLIYVNSQWWEKETSTRAKQD